MNGVGFEILARTPVPKLPPLPPLPRFTYYSTAPLPECGGTLTASTGYFRPVDADVDDLFNDDIHCLWRITAGSDRKIQLTVSDVDIPDFYRSIGLNCRDSFLQVRPYPIANYKHIC